MKTEQKQDIRCDRISWKKNTSRQSDISSITFSSWGQPNTRLNKDNGGGGEGGGWGGWGLKELLREKNIETKVFPIAKFSMVAQVAQWYPVFYSIISCFQFLNSIKSNPVSFHLLPSSFESLDPTPELKTNTEPLGTIFR